MAALAPVAMVAQGIGGAATAVGTIAGGSYSAAAGKMQKVALTNEANTAFASGQRKMFDTQQQSNLLQSKAEARAGASGVDAGYGSPNTDIGEIAQRGSYHALMDMFNGKSRADSLRYEGDLAENEGEMKEKASYLSALGTIGGTAGSMFKTYGAFTYPTPSGRPSVSF